jgi:hypothetical protein
LVRRQSLAKTGLRVDGYWYPLKDSAAKKLASYLLDWWELPPVERLVATDGSGDESCQGRKPPQPQWPKGPPLQGSLPGHTPPLRSTVSHRSPLVLCTLALPLTSYIDPLS